MPWSRVNQRRIPFNAVMAVAVLALILTLPAIKGNKDGVTVAFTAVVSIGVIGLYVCWAVPIYLRWRAGDAFERGPWNLGNKYKWMNPIALIEILIVVIIYFNLPFSSGGVPWEDDFDWNLFNYTPVVTGGLALVIGLWWVLSAKKWFTGPEAHGRRDRRRDRPAAAASGSAVDRRDDGGVGRPAGRGPADRTRPADDASV